MSMHDGDLVLVTGASGYIAMHVVRDLLKANYRVRGSVRSLKNETKVAPLQELCPEAKYPLELVEAELLIGAGWEDAVKGCKYVLHIASPVPTDVIEDEKKFIHEAVEGTMNVLRACHKAGSVARVVITGSMASVAETRKPGQVLTEADWTDDTVSSVWGYSKSKTRAEKAAWEFVKNLPTDERFELVVLNPGFVLGPMLCNYVASGSEAIRRLLVRDFPIVPNIHMPCVHMSDVSAAHLAAITVPGAAGHRHIIYEEARLLSDMAQTLKTEFQKQGYNIPTRKAPSWLLKCAAVFRKDARTLKPLLDKEYHVDNTRMTKVLGVVPKHSLDQAILDLAYDLIEKGFVPKKHKYIGRSLITEGTT